MIVSGTRFIVVRFILWSGGGFNKKAPTKEGRWQWLGLQGGTWYLCSMETELFVENFIHDMVHLIYIWYFCRKINTLDHLYIRVFLTLLLGYWFSKDILNQSNPLCTYIISSNHITLAHSDNIFISNGHFYYRNTLCVWCKCYNEFIIATSLYTYLIFKAFFVTVSHSFLYSLVINVCSLTPWILTLSYFLIENAIKHNRK